MLFAALSLYSRAYVKISLSILLLNPLFLRDSSKVAGGIFMKRVVALVIACAMSLALFGCGKSN